MNLMCEPSVNTLMSPQIDLTPAAPGHDLPVLAAQEEPAFRPEWESLIADGVQPALILGAERRAQGRR